MLRMEHMVFPLLVDALITTVGNGTVHAAGGEFWAGA
jgi:hypothetical protein